MKAFLVALVVMGALAVGADFYLHELGFSSADVYSTQNVRLGE